MKIMQRIAKVFSRTETRQCYPGYCSFCNRNHKEVGPLAEGPNFVFICGKCIELCGTLISKEQQRIASTAASDRAE